jgi:hypothetical protein
MDAMRRLLLLLPLLMLLQLAACGGGGGVRKRVFPPVVSVQELVERPDGGWALKLRLQNFSNVSMRFDAVEATLKIGSDEAGTINLQPMLSVGPESADVVDYTLQPDAGAAAQVHEALGERRSVTYSIDGTVRSTDPDSRRDSFSHQSQLSAVPGLAGTLR